MKILHKAKQKIVDGFYSFIETQTPVLFLLHIAISAMVILIYRSFKTDGMQGDHLVNSNIVSQVDAAPTGLTKQGGEFAFSDVGRNITLMEWIDAAATNDDVAETFNVSILVEKSNASNLHSPKTLSKRVIIRNANSLDNVTLRDVVDKLSVLPEFAEKP